MATQEKYVAELEQHVLEIADILKEKENFCGGTHPDNTHIY
jgi:hypothetical protein